jgi:hypothetical protein
MILRQVEVKEAICPTCRYLDRTLLQSGQEITRCQKNENLKLQFDRYAQECSMYAERITRWGLFKKCSAALFARLRKK